MIVDIPGYRITEEIYQGTRTEVYRGLNEAGTPVIIKKLRNAYPTFNELVQFRHQYTLTKNINIAGIVNFIALEKYGNGYLLISEDFGGVSLEQYMGDRPLTLDEFLPIAIALAEILEDLHRQQVIHKDIKPSNIIIHPETKQVKLIDFSISSRLPRETQVIQNPNILEGTLAYISPEQTGRMNRGIDYRSDFYSLGVTFYQLLTGQLPFQSDDPMELVHCHIAKMPLPISDRIEEAQPPISYSQNDDPGKEQLSSPSSPSTMADSIPQVISDLVMKLMAKTAEHRYQSAAGLKHDLTQCGQEWQNYGNISDFDLARRDISERFTIPETLYGREAEVAQLLAAFNRVASSHPSPDCFPSSLPSWEGRGWVGLGVGSPSSQSELLLVAGFSGIGKTAVINEVHKPIVEKRGYFIEGKFDQFNRNIPFSAFVQAFRDLMGQLLSESQSQLQAWKEKILAALGENAQAIVEVIPELERIIGRQPPVAELSGSAAANRFNLLFSKFVRIFATKEHPLVIFLDDLQWADSASLNLLKLLMSDSDSGHLLILGAYRDNEVFPAHPLMLTLAEIENAKAQFGTITLAPLAESDLVRLVADTLLCSHEMASPLAELVYQKTQGNPFFATQFLKGLHQDGGIFFDPRESADGGVRGWQWDLVKVRELALTDDVVEFMTGRLHKLPTSTQEVLKLAACIGNRFDLDTLAVVCERSPVEVATDLWQALQEGMVLPNNESYKFFEEVDREQTSEIAIAEYRFLHDRVQQAAYSLIQEERKPSTHLKIGQQLLAKIPKNQQESRIFEIVNQLNMGRELLDTSADRQQCLELNYLAGKRAKESTAYAAAIGYLEMAIDLLTDDSWDSVYDLTLDLYTNLAEAKYLDGNFSESEALVDRVVQCAKTNLDKAHTYNILIIQYTLQGKFAEALDSGITALAFLAFHLSEDNCPARLEELVPAINRKLADRKTAELLDEPDCQSAEKAAAIAILNNLLVPCYVLQKEDLYFVVTLAIVDLALTYGMVAESSYGFASYGMFLGARGGDARSGYEFGELAVNLSKRFSQQNDLCRACYVLGNNLLSWVKPLRNCEPIFNEGFAAGLESGEFVFAANILMYKLLNPFFAGGNIEQIFEEIPEYIKTAKTLNYQLTSDVIQGLNIWLVNLTNAVETRNLASPPLTEEQFFQECQEHNSTYAICHYLILKTKVLYLYGDYEESLQASQEAYKIINVILGKYQVAALNFYQSLTLLALCKKSASDRTVNGYRQQIQDNQRQLLAWSKNCPQNFEHKYSLVEAELARLSQQKIAASEGYDRAIAAAKDNGYIQEVAIANELAAQFYFAWEKERIANTYLQEAYYYYQLWGATAKVNALAAKYSYLVAAANDSDIAETRTTISKTSSGSASTLDIGTAMKASQAISKEIMLDKLLSSLMKILIENAGAQRGYLILADRDRLLIEAEGDVNRDANGDSNGDRITILESKTLTSCRLSEAIVNYVARMHESLVLNDATRQGKFTNDPYIKEYQPKSILCVPLINQGNLVSIVYLENNLTTGAFTPDRLQLLKLLSSQAAISIQNAKLYAKVCANEARLFKLNQAYERFVPSQFLDLLDRNSIVDVELGDQVQLEMSVLFSDIRSFTTLSEKMTPDENFKFINSYLSCMEPAILENNGFIDKYIGDAIMALFSGSADRAVKAAISMQHRLAEYNQARANCNDVAIATGIGINTGSLILGTVGGTNRMDTTVISDAVNLASRVESLTKNYGVSLLITEFTYSRLKNPTDYSIRTIDTVKVKGKSQAVTVYEVFDGDTVESKAGKLATLSKFTEAIALYHQSNLADAASLFADCLQENEGDRVAQIYWQRCQ